MSLIVCSTKCDQCLFSKNKIVSDERKKEILEDCQKTGKFFVCHKASIKGKEAVCAGFEKYKHNTNPQLQLAKRLPAVFGQFIKRVNPEEL